MKLQTFGANLQVTGSCYLLNVGGLRVLIDCGLYQERDYLARNWDPFPFAPNEIDVLLLTHVHLDHCGLIPKFVRAGYSKKILMTSASKDLLPIMLLDAARLQEEDAQFKKKRHEKEGRKGQYPEQPLYTEEDVERVFPFVQDVPYGEIVSLNNRVSVRFHDAGHILGSAMLEFTVRNGNGAERMIFSGDIGQWNKPILKDPTAFEQADYIVMETTYGDRLHEDTGDVKQLLCDIVNETLRKQGNIIVPVFAIERAQELMFHWSRLVREKCIPVLMNFLDSPMAVNATEVFENHPECLDEETLRLIREKEQPFEFPGLKFVRTTEESKAINNIRGSCIIMAGSGMCTGGRIKHHLIQNISRPESTILFVGYQALGTLGRQIVDGAKQVRIHGQEFPVRARIAEVHGFSGHADQRGLLKWLEYFKMPPRKLVLSHGDKEASETFAEIVRKRWGWNISIPGYREELELP